MIGAIGNAIAGTMTGLPRSVRRALAVIAIAAAVIAAGAAWLALHDRRVVADHQAEATAKAAQATIRADRAAIAADAVREVQRQADSAATRKAIDHAEQDHPEAVRRPAGPSVRAAADSLRRRAATSRHAAP